MVIANTGVTKVGTLLKRQSDDQWEPFFFVLNDHCLTYCSAKHNFEKPDGNLLLTPCSKAYQEEGTDESAVIIRIETGCEVLFLKSPGGDVAEMKEWMRAIHLIVSRLPQLARGHFDCKLTTKGRVKVKEFFLMLHKECITVHPSLSETVKIVKSYQLLESSSFDVSGGGSIEFKSGKGDETLVCTAKNEIEHQHWCYALDMAISSLRKEVNKTVVPPPTLPLHSGALHFFDTSSMKWSKKYVVLADDGLYMHANRRVGFDAPVQFKLTPNAMVFVTILRDYAFEVVLFSEPVHLSASSEAEREEWMFFLQNLIPRSDYDAKDALQAASLEKGVEVRDTYFHSENSPGVWLERRGNWAIAGIVHESLSRKICKGSILSKIDGVSTMLMGFDSVVSAVSNWRPPLKLSFILSPIKMGWLNLMTKDRRGSWWTRRKSKEVTWNAVKVYATLSSGVLKLFDVKRDGKSEVRAFTLFGSAIGLVEPFVMNGAKHCFRVFDGIEPCILQAVDRDLMMDWATSIAQCISMENGGGILLDKAKKAVTAERNTVPPSIFRGVGNEAVSAAQSQVVVIAKPMQDILAAPIVFEDGNKVLPLEPINEDNNLNTVHAEDATAVAHHKGNDLNRTHATDVTDEAVNNTFDSWVLNTMYAEDTTAVTLHKGNELNRTHATNVTDEAVNNTFDSLDPADVSRTMEGFARSFFVTKACDEDGSFPTQELRAEDPHESWDAIDRVSSTSSGEEAFDKACDESSHINTSDFKKLVEFTKETVTLRTN